MQSVSRVCACWFGLVHHLKKYFLHVTLDQAQMIESKIKKCFRQCRVSTPIRYFSTKSGIQNTVGKSIKGEIIYLIIYLRNKSAIMQIVFKSMGCSYEKFNKKHIFQIALWIFAGTYLWSLFVSIYRAAFHLKISALILYHLNYLANANDIESDNVDLKY